MIWPTSSALSICSPSMLTNRSPGFSPAANAGACWSSSSHSVCVLVAGTTHSETLPIVVLFCGTPNRQSTTAYSTIAMSRFMVGPPSMMMMRFQTASL